MRCCKQGRMPSLKLTYPCTGNSSSLIEKAKDKQETEPEHRQRKPQDGKHHDEPIHPGANGPGGHDAHGHCQHDGDEHRCHRQGQSRFEPLSNQFGDGKA